MNKVLVIKGANFSSNKVEKIGVNGKYYLTEEDAIAQTDAFISTDASSSTGFSWSRRYPNAKYTFYSIEAGDIVEIPYNDVHGQRVAFVTSLDTTSNSEVQFVPNTTVYTTNANQNKGVAAHGGFKIRAIQDCYLAVHTLSDGINVFPDGMDANVNYVAERIFTEDNYVKKGGNRYLTSSNTWNYENNTIVNYAGLYYSVFAGETIHINNTSDRAVSFGTIPIGDTEYTSGTNNRQRYRVEAGNTLDLIIEKDMYIWVYTYASDVHIFPTGLISVTREEENNG